MSFLKSAYSLARGATRGALASLDDLRKAEGGPIPSQAPKDPAKTLMLDPYNGLTQMGYRDPSNGMSYQMLRLLTKRTPVVASIIQTRTNQLALFAKPQANKFDLGFKIKLRNASASPSKAAKARIEEMQRFITQCGVEDGHQYRDTFSQYLRKVGRDTLTLGHDATEILPNGRGEPAAFVAVDATTIRLAEDVPENDNLKPEEVIRYVQTFNNQVVTEYTFDEMAFGVRLPTTDIENQGYGMSELEMLTEVITNLLNIYQYNGNFFSSNSLPRGMINLRGDVSTEMLEGFRRHWYAMLSGVEGSWLTPIANSKDGIEFVNMQGQSNNDMQMQAWHEMMVRCATAVFSISPDEIGFGMGPMGMTSSLNAPTNTDKVTEGRERGLLPLLHHFQHNLNNHIIRRIDPDFTFEFVGLSGMTRDQQTTQANAQVTTYRTIDEIRAEEDLAPMPDDSGKIILNPIWLQNQSMKDQASQTAAQGGQPAAQGEDQDQGGTQGGGSYSQALAGPQGEDDGKATNDDKEPTAAAPKALARSMTEAQRLVVPSMRRVTLHSEGWYRRNRGGG